MLQHYIKVVANFIENKQTNQWLKAERRKKKVSNVKFHQKFPFPVISQL